MFELSCPVCLKPLQGDNKHLECADRHSFDAARQGYWNLLLANQKRSKAPGDNAEMVQARREFLALGHYQQLADRVSGLVSDCCAPVDHPRIVDMGCGEGYYTDRMQRSLTEKDRPFQLAGLDISKFAVRAACHLNRDITWMVASGARMPVADSSLDLVTVLFSRLMPEEFSRTLKPGGKLLVVYPGPRHLIELRELIYDEVRDSHYDPEKLMGEQFSLASSEQLKYVFTLPDQQQIQQLLAMTPHGWRISQNARERIADLEQLNLTLDVNLALFERCPL